MRVLQLPRSSRPCRPSHSTCAPRAPRAGAPWTDAAVSEFLTAARQLLAQPEFAAEGEAARQRQPAPAEPSGVYTMEETRHQAP